MQTTRPRNLALAAALVVGVVGGAAVVRAAGAGAVSVQVPYTGHLDQNGVAVNAATNMTFTIFDDPVAGTALSSDDVIVTPTNGLFSVVLGRGTDPLTATELDARELWLEISVEGAVVGARQQIYAATQAVRADSANGFSVRGALDVAAGATIRGGANVTGGIVSDGVSLSTSKCVSVIDNNGKTFDICGAASQGGVTITHRAATNAGFFRAGALSLSDSLVESSGDLRAAGDAVVSGDLSVAGALTIPFAGGTAHSDNLTAKFEHVPGACTPNTLSIEPAVLGTTGGLNTGLCMCLSRNSAQEKWCVHPPP